MTSSPSPQMSPSGEADSLLGTTVGGRFRIEKRLAAGGMGVVYKAEQVPLGRPVAVKVLKQPPNPDLDESFSKRFLLEAAAVANLHHPHTIVVHDYGRDGDLLYFAMEYLEGQTLTEHVSSKGPMHPADAIHVGLQVASSLQDAHAQGLVHRDLKPSNVMLTHRGGDPLFVKVLDFGLVKMVSRQEDDKKNRLTQSGIMLGSPRYMAPEQVRGSDVDHRADIYAFGAMLCFMLTGKPPFPNGSQFEAMRAHVYQQAPKLRELFPECRASERLEQIVLRCLEKKPDDRFAWLGQIVDALKHAALAPEDTEDDAKPTLFREPSMVAPARDLAGDPAAASAAWAAGASALVPQTAVQLEGGSAVAPQFAMPPAAASSVAAAAPGPGFAEPTSVGAPSSEAAPSAALTWALRIGLVLLFVTGAVVAAVVFPGASEDASGDEGGDPRVIDVSGGPTPTPTVPPDVPPTGALAGGATPDAPTDEPSSPEPSPAVRAPVLHLTRIVSEPATARVTREGADLGDAPLSVRIPEGESWVVVVSADGYEPRELTLVGGAQADVLVRLERSRRSPGAAPRGTRDDAPAPTTMEPTRDAPTPTVGGSTIRDPWN